MGTFASEYPAGLRQRFVADALADGAPAVAELVRRAHAGDYGPELRKLPASTGREWVATAKADRDAAELAKAGDGASAATIAAEALELLQVELAAVKRKARRPRGSLDVPRVEQLVRAAREAERARQAAGGNAPLKGNGKVDAAPERETGAPEAPPSDDAVSPLAAAALRD